jgi:hypothetical protein
MILVAGEKLAKEALRTADSAERKKAILHVIKTGTAYMPLVDKYRRAN